MTRVLIVDDVKILRECLRMVINQCPGFEVLGCAADGREACQLCEQQQPDVVLMDLNMPVLSGQEAIIRIKAMNPHIKILVLTAEGAEEEIARAFQNGADGYVLKNIAPADLTVMIHKTHQGQPFIHDSAFCVGQGVFQNGTTQHQSSLDPPRDFTDREKEVLRLVMTGMTNEEIAEGIGVSAGRARNIVAELISKCMVKNRTQLAVMAVSMKELHQPERSPVLVPSPGS
jgi:DNA-binding NarL/FixJ family response regulator